MIKEHMKTVLAVGLTFGLSTVHANADCHGGRLWTKGGPTVNITAGDGIPDPIRVFPRNVQGEEYVFAITDNESSVLAYSSGNIFDLEGAGGGICRIYGIAYAGDFDMPTGVPVHSLTAGGCLSVSDNHITVHRKAAAEIDGGWIISDSRGRGTVHIDLGNPYPIRAYSTSEAAATSSYSYVITDNEGYVLAYPPANEFDFSPAPPGICRIYGISYTGTLAKTTGIPIYEVISDENNQELSRNYIRVMRFEE